MSIKGLPFKQRTITTFIIWSMKVPNTCLWNKICIYKSKVKAVRVHTHTDSDRNTHSLALINSFIYHIEEIEFFKFLVLVCTSFYRMKRKKKLTLNTVFIIYDIQTTITDYIWCKKTVTAAKNKNNSSFEMKKERKKERKREL